MKKIALITALAASVAAPAFAQSPLQLAVENHNESVNMASDRITGDLTVFSEVTPQRGSALAQAIAINNASADSFGDRIESASVSTVSGPTGRAAEIFAALEAADTDND